MSPLSVGIVGLPNVGKSTLFNALLKKQAVLAANFPFATVNPNVGIVGIEDERLNKLAKVVEGEPPIVPSRVKFVDIAGLVKGASKGEGLGNKFLAHIREVNAVVHVLRDFEDASVVKEGSVDPQRDFEVVETELMLADLETLQKQKEPKGAASKEEKAVWETVVKLKTGLEKGLPARKVSLEKREKKLARLLSLLTMKPVLFMINVSSEDLDKSLQLEKDWAGRLGVGQERVVVMSAKLEAEIAELESVEREQMLAEYGIERAGVERLAQKAFGVLGLITFLTAGEKEVRAWTIRRGQTAQEAAGVIHSDFAKNFIKAKVIEWQKFVEIGGWKEAGKRGLVRSEGREYIVEDGDVVEFMAGR